MRNIVNPLQTQIFDPFDPILTKKTRKRLLDTYSTTHIELNGAL
jgi:hypothetical protein